MSEQNPYQSPRVGTPRKMNWGAIISRTIGSLMLIYWLSLVFDSGIADDPEEPSPSPEDFLRQLEQQGEAE